jgi:preprotein translocase subunit YajC
MKKIRIMLIGGLLGLISSGAANAVDLNTGGTTDITLLTCTQLANDIKVVLSSGVAGSVDCTTDANWMAVSVCHTAGLTSSRSYSTSITSAACTTQSGTWVASTSKCEGTTTGPAYPTATTAAGTVGSVYPGGTACSTANAAAQATAAIQAIP